jgi:hypothetical protein
MRKLKLTCTYKQKKETHATQIQMQIISCWLVVKLGTPQDRRLDRSDERQKQKGDCERTKGEGEMSTLNPQPSLFRF